MKIKCYIGIVLSSVLREIVPVMYSGGGRRREKEAMLVGFHRGVTAILPFHAIEDVPHHYTGFLWTQGHDLRLLKMNAAFKSEKVCSRN